MGREKQKKKTNRKCKIWREEEREREENKHKV